MHEILNKFYKFTGLVEPTIGGEIAVGDFTKKAQEVCAAPNTEEPFMCLDLTFISVLLTDGYGLNPQKQIRVRF